MQDPHACAVSHTDCLNQHGSQLKHEIVQASKRKNTNCQCDESVEAEEAWQANVIPIMDFVGLGVGLGSLGVTRSRNLRREESGT